MKPSVGEHGKCMEINRDYSDFDGWYFVINDKIARSDMWYDQVTVPKLYFYYLDEEQGHDLYIKDFENFVYLGKNKDIILNHIMNFEEELQHYFRFKYAGGE